MSIDNITIGDFMKIAELLKPNSNTECPVEIGKAYLFRTVTHIEVGRATEIHGPFVRIEDASWIADTGRYHDCLRDGVFNEVEPYPDYSVVNTASLINYAPWNHPLPKEQK